MGIVSAQSYVQSLLSGLTPPGSTGLTAPISALITPLDPDVNADGIARIYVWPASGPEKRLAIPRNNTGINSAGGWKTIKHDIQVFLVWMDNPDDPNRDINFPLLIDFVMNILRTSPNAPAFWTDPVTGVQTQMVDLGEDMTYEFVPPRTLEAQGQLRYDARIKCTLTEIFQA